MKKVPEELLQAAQHLAEFSEIAFAGWGRGRELEEAMQESYIIMLNSFLKLLIENAHPCECEK